MKTIAITIDDETLARVDRLGGRSRSRAIREAVQEYVARRERWADEKRDPVRFLDAAVQAQTCGVRGNLGDDQTAGTATGPRERPAADSVTINRPARPAVTSLTNG